jgi:hypothetical protein
MNGRGRVAAGGPGVSHACTARWTRRCRGRRLSLFAVVAITAEEPAMSMVMDIAVSVTGLVKTFGRTRALDGWI